MQENKNIICYSVNTTDKFNSKEEIEKKLKNIYQAMLRRKHTDERFRDISFIVGTSETKSSGAYISYNRTGKRGRPKRVVVGEKIPWHLHIYVISIGEYASTFSEEIIKYLKKRGFETSKNKNDSVNNALNYLERQSLYKRTGGDYFKSKNSNLLK
ncbi:MAG: hypothetical protein E7161_01075 [Firmicutes bacterium]|nr:hypothetical protein [Bacillota bacterium]